MIINVNRKVLLINYNVKFNNFVDVVYVIIIDG